MPSRLRMVRISVAIGLLTGSLGCGSGAPAQQHLSGTITFKGAPVAGGMIYFEPAAGNSGHTGFARIAAGRYDTAAEGGKGHVGGKLSVRIEPGVNLTEPIFDDNAPKPPRPFTVWHEILEVPAGKLTHDFLVPDDADRMMQEKPRARSNDP